MVLCIYGFPSNVAALQVRAPLSWLVSASVFLDGKHRYVLLCADLNRASVSSAVRVGVAAPDGVPRRAQGRRRIQVAQRHRQQGQARLHHAQPPLMGKVSKSRFL